MSSPRKFRVWDGEEMHEPPHEYIYDPREGARRVIDASDGRVTCGHLIDCEVLWSTGLTDTEGTEIWEGDWFQADDLDRPRCVLWSDADAGWKLIDPRGALRMFPVRLLGEVIGNRYEDPELLQ